jgi:hypothetical protein
MWLGELTKTKAGASGSARWIKTTTSRFDVLVSLFKCIQPLFDCGEPVSYLFHAMFDGNHLRPPHFRPCFF